MDPPPDFRVDQSSDGDVVTVRVVGDVDLATAPELDAALAAAVASGEPCVHVDLGGVTFYGSEGVRSLVDLLARASRAGREVAIVEASPVVRRVLEVVGLDERIRPGGADR
jgi:anti-anti-sigma factor